MPPESPPLPPKPEVALALLQTASSVYVHLDPRSETVHVPPWFKNQPQLVLQIGLNMAVPIPDLDVGRDSISCTLSFNRRPEFCRIPWEAIYGLVGEDGRGMIWPESVPPEVASAAGGRANKKPHLRLADESPSDGKEPSTPKAKKAKLDSVGGGKSSEAQAEPDSAGAEVRSFASVERSEAGVRDGGSLSASAAQKSRSSAGRRKELPPYLRVVK